MLDFTRPLFGRIIRPDNFLLSGLSDIRPESKIHYPVHPYSVGMQRPYSAGVGASASHAGNLACLADEPGRSVESEPEDFRRSSVSVGAVQSFPGHKNLEFGVARAGPFLLEPGLSGIFPTQHPYFPFLSGRQKDQVAKMYSAGQRENV